MAELSMPEKTPSPNGDSNSVGTETEATPSVTPATTVIRQRSHEDADPWRIHKDKILKLYYEDRRPLREVMLIMSREHHFNSS